jgi:hypothetical protein
MAYRIAPVVNPRTLMREATMMSFYSMRLFPDKQTDAVQRRQIGNRWLQSHNEWMWLPPVESLKPFIQPFRRS